MKSKVLTVNNMALIAMFAAVTAVLSQIIIPLPFTPAPINLATLSVFLAGGLLGAKRGCASQMIYVLLGIVGMPVFTNFRAGFNVITGPTGGYIAGYVLSAFVIGLLKNKLPQKTVWYALNMAVGAVCYFTLGTIWFMFLTKSTLTVSLTMCVIPFIPGDILKIILSAFLVKRIDAVSIPNL